jgi:IS5 family transposase
MTAEGDLFRTRLEQIINMKHELVQLAGKVVASCGFARNPGRREAPFHSDDSQII